MEIKLKNIVSQPLFPLAVFFIVSGLICVTALRHNNTQMIKLRDAVYAADKNDGDINAALNNLRAYVYGHMNTNLSTGTSVRPPIQLPYTYERLASKAEQSTNTTGLYTDAENYCQAVVPASVSISGRGRISCVQDYIMGHGGKQPTPIPASLYEFDFVSPSWSPDLAGWSLVAVIISGISLVGGLLLARYSRFKLPTI